MDSYYNIFARLQPAHYYSLDNRHTDEHILQYTLKKNTFGRVTSTTECNSDNDNGASRALKRTNKALLLYVYSTRPSSYIL